MPLTSLTLKVIGLKRIERKSGSGIEGLKAELGRGYSNGFLRLVRTTKLLG